MATRVVCWSCGGALDGVPRPIRHHTQCPECRAELHVCRMCTHFDRHLIGQCAHDRADRVLDKKKANYCTYYAPRPNAHTTAGTAADDASRGALEQLFGLGADGRQAREPPGSELGIELPAEEASSPQALRAKARTELEKLFGAEEPAADRSGGEDEPGDKGTSQSG